MPEDHARVSRSKRRHILRLLGLAAFGFATSALLPARQRSMRSATMNKSSVKLFLCGDVMTGRGIDQILPHPGDPRLYEAYVRDARDYVKLAERENGPIKIPIAFNYIWGDTLIELKRQRPDVRIVNLETAITASGDNWPKGINYRMHPANVPCLTAAAIDCCVLTNNHVLDWGYAGLEETLLTLTNAGIKFAGAGRTLAEAQAPAIIALPEKGRVVVFSLGTESSGIDPDWRATTDGPGVNLLPDLSTTTVHRIAEQVRRVKRGGDIVIASIHWGGNWGYDISHDQRQFSRGLIESANIDVIHGHSSHHVKGVEVYQGRPIIYGCGDFLTDYEGIGGHEEFRDDLGLMYFPTLEAESGRLLSFQMTPTRLNKLQVNRASFKEAEWLAGILDREGMPLGTRVMFEPDHRLLLHWN